MVLCLFPSLRVLLSINCSNIDKTSYLHMQPHTFCPLYLSLEIYFCTLPGSLPELSHKQRILLWAQWLQTIMTNKGRSSLTAQCKFRTQSNMMHKSIELRAVRKLNCRLYQAYSDKINQVPKQQIFHLKTLFIIVHDRFKEKSLNLGLKHFKGALLNTNGPQNHGNTGWKRPRRSFIPTSQVLWDYCQH